MDLIVYLGRSSATRDVRSPPLDLFTISPPLQYQTAAGSLVDPATSTSALAVGALCWQTRQLEPYSSQGPTIHGRIKPDLAGHDSVSGATYGRGHLHVRHSPGPRPPRRRWPVPRRS